MLKLRSPASLPLIAPSILSADFAQMGEDCEHVLNAGADLLHLDVMDGHFAPNLTMGPDMCRALRKRLGSAYLDVHLMVQDPGAFIDPFAKAGTNCLTFHVEAVAAPLVKDLAHRIRSLGLEVGLAINPPTPLNLIAPHLHDVDMILVMSVNPGFSGQSFIEPVLEKTAAIRSRLGPNTRIQMDGGINLQNAAKVRNAGCDVLVAASAIFGRPPAERSGVIAGMRGH